MRFSIVIPCFNEAATLPTLLSKCSEVVARSDQKLEFIIVDNGSTDETSQIIDKMIMSSPGCHSIRVDTNEGYGNGILKGLVVATGDVIGWTHADMQTDPADILAAMDCFKKDSEVGFVKGLRKGRPFFDLIFTVGMSVFETFYLRKKLWDINAQPTLFHRKFFKKWENPPKDFSLDLFAYSEAKRQQLNVIRFPVRFEKRLHGTSSWNVDWKSKLRFIKRTILFSHDLKNRRKS